MHNYVIIAGVNIKIHLICLITRIHRYLFSLLLLPRFNLNAVTPLIQPTNQEALEKHGSVFIEVKPCIFIGPPEWGSPP